MLSALIGAASSIAGGLLGNKAADKANKQAQENALRQEALQKEFAQSGIQWKVADAEKAGIHPLYALGANTVSYSPQSIGSTGSDFSFLGNAGQNIGRAIQAGSSNNKRAEAIALTASQIQLEGLQLDNELKRANLASAIQLAQQSGPGLPSLFTRRGPTGIDGQGDSPQDDTIPLMHSARQPQYTTNLRAAGKDIQPSPNWSDAQTYEDRYGEISDYIMGPAIAYQDWWHNVKPYLDQKVYGRLRR